MKSFKKFTALIAVMALIFALGSCHVNLDEKPVTYSVTVAEGIEHGTISASETSAEKGTEIKLTATPDEGYELEAYSVKDSDENEITVTDGAFVMPKSNVTVSATFKLIDSGKPDPEKPNITVTLNEGGETTALTLNEDGKITKPTDPAKDGYAFAGWYDGDTAFDFESVVTKSITLTAKWEVITYKITYAGVDGATNPNTATIYTVESEDITLAAATKTGFTFGGWKNANGEAVTKIAKGTTGDITLTATWIDITKPTFTVTFTVDGESTTQTVEENAKATKPKDPVKEGYTFADWYNGSAKFDFETAITENITLTAKWTPVTYKITYAGIDGATNPNTATTYIIENNDITLKDASKDGYTFAGWKNAKGEVVTKIAKGSTGDITLTANWTAITYKITYAGVDGATNPNTAATYTIESNEITLSNASKTGYTFGGWKNASGATITKINKGSTGDITLTATWTAITYKITYAGVDGATNPNTATTYTVNDEITLSNATKAGFNFGGWKNAKGEAVTKIAKGTTGDITLTATWIELSKPTCTVTFTIDGESTTQTVEENSKAATPTAPTKTGYTFAGWYNGDKKFDFDTPITANITLTANWTADTYKITYAGIDGATNPNTATTYTIESNEITLSNATKTGYTFGGWKNAKGEVVTKIAKGTTGDITLTATWTPATNTAYKVLHYKQNAENDEYTLADTDNLTGTTAAQTSAEAKTYEHFTAGTVTQAEIAADGSTEVKIYYTRETITFTVDLAGGSLGTYTGIVPVKGKYGQSLSAVLTAMYGQQLTAMPNPTRLHYAFCGWNTNDGTIPSIFETSATYTALWSNVNSITMTIAPNSTIGITKTETTDTIILTADEGFSYNWNDSWRIDGNQANIFKGASLNDTNRILTIEKTSFIKGYVYQISVNATKNGMPYGAQITVKVEQD